MTETGKTETGKTETGKDEGAETGTVALRGLKVRGYHGFFPEERSVGQDFVIDATLGLDTEVAARSDDLADTADYGALAQRLAAIVQGEPVNLIETLAERLADACLLDAHVRWCEVTVHKPQAPIPLAFDDVAVTVRRRVGDTG